MTTSTPPAPLGAASLVLYGPPGTGKTTRLLQLLESEFDDAGTDPRSIAFVSFTRAARTEARNRTLRKFTTLREEDLDWFRTVHSTCYRLLRLNQGAILTGGRWREFADKHGYIFSDITTASLDGFEMPRRTADDRLRFSLEWGRSRRLNLTQTAEQCPVECELAALKQLNDRLLAFKHEHVLMDFTDLIENCLWTKRTPPCRVLFVDEAQDLSPVQIAAIELWAKSMDRVYVAGDDDQAIYAFSGAEPGWLVSLRERCTHVEILDQSYRVPQRVHTLAQRVIGRNTLRVRKDYRPHATELGSVEIMSRHESALAAIRHLEERPTGDVFVLARNRAYLQPWAEVLTDAAVPFVLEGRGGVNPLGDTPKIAAVRAAMVVLRDEPLQPQQLRDLLEQVPSKHGDVRLVAHGAKVRAEENADAVPRAALALEWGMGAWLDLLADKGPGGCFPSWSMRERDFYNRMLLLGGGELPTPRIHLTTIHGSKGREADVVIVIPDMSRATYDDYTDDRRPESREAETRCAYVAITRAKRRLILQAPETQRFFPYEDILGEAPPPRKASDAKPAARAFWSDAEDLPF